MLSEDRKMFLKIANYFMVLNITRKNVLRKIEERLKTSKVKLKDSLMYFNDDVLN